jgi:hypothetical protein
MISPPIIFYHALSQGFDFFISSYPKNSTTAPLEFHGNIVTFNKIAPGSKKGKSLLAITSCLAGIERVQYVKTAESLASCAVVRQNR